jgi:ABC-2 type transport system permease protein
MRKVLNIAAKDLLVVFRDPGALVMMLVTPFALTLAIAFAFGGLTGSGAGGTGLQHIPVVIVNHDPGQLGAALVQAFESQDLSQLMQPTLVSDDGAARARVDAGQAAAAVLIPADLTASIEDGPGGAAGAPAATIEVYAGPTAPISAGVVRSIVDRFLGQVAAGWAGARVSIQQLLAAGLISPQQAPDLGRQIGQQSGAGAAGAPLITVQGQTAAGGSSRSFDWLGYMAPSMAILFLMFTVSAGGRSILAERDEGTLPRLLISPTPAVQALSGKVFGTFITGLAQIAILIAASGLLFGVDWGNPAGVALLAMALVAAATAWGMLIAAFSRTPGQANAIGTAIALVFGAAAGNFLPRQTLPGALQTASLITPNAWGLEGFAELARGGTLASEALPIAALLAMAVILLGLAIVGFRRQYV